MAWNWSAVDNGALDAFQDALPPKPAEPAGYALPDDILHMTLAEIKAYGKSPEHDAAWRRYELDLATWEAEREATRQRIYGPAKARYDAAFAAYSSALGALAHHRVTSLNQLGEKIEIIVADYDGCEIPPGYMHEIIADVRHLDSEVRS